MTLKEVVFHEAGHAVIDYAIGIRVISLRIIEFPAYLHGDCLSLDGSEADAKVQIIGTLAGQFSTQLAQNADPSYLYVPTGPDRFGASQDNLTSKSLAEKHINDIEGPGCWEQLEQRQLTIDKRKEIRRIQSERRQRADRLMDRLRGETLRLVTEHHKAIIGLADRVLAQSPVNIEEHHRQLLGLLETISIDGATFRELDEGQITEEMNAHGLSFGFLQQQIEAMKVP